MEINTRFGKQTVDPETVIRFPEGLPGFEDSNEFTLFHEDGKPSVFYLQSLKDPHLQLPVINPAVFQVDYEFLLTDEESAIVDIDDMADIAVLVTVSEDGNQDGGLHANFMGPIIINTRKRVGYQKRLNEIKGSIVIKAE